MLRRRFLSKAAALCACASLALLLAPGAVVPRVAAAPAATLPVTAVDSVGMTVSDMNRALAFYTEVLPFAKVSDREVSSRPYELLSGVAGAHSRVVRLRLGAEEIELTEFVSPKGRPMPVDVRSNDRIFQHIAIVVSDMERAYAVLRAREVEHASIAPQRLPDWNPNAGGITAFYFRDPDRHFLEIIHYPAGKGAPKWQSAGSALFLGIDHTAIVVDNTELSLALYRDVFGMRVAGESENYEIEQERLNNVFGARLRITGLTAERGPGIEFLEYLAPRDGRPAPVDLRANDVSHWQTTLVTERLDPVLALAREHRIALVSPGPVDTTVLPLGFRAGALVRDPDGHGLRLITR